MEWRWRYKGGWTLDNQHTINSTHYLNSPYIGKKVVLIKPLHFAQDLHYITLIRLASQQNFPLKACVNLPDSVFKSKYLSGY